MPRSANRISRSNTRTKDDELLRDSWNLVDRLFKLVLQPCNYVCEGLLGFRCAHAVLRVRFYHLQLADRPDQ